MTHGTVSGYRAGCRCAECKEAKAADARDYYQRNRDARLAYAAKYHVENRERLLARMAEWRAQSVEERAAYRRSRRENDREYRRQYAQTPQGRAVNMAKVHRRRARQREADHGCVTAADLAALAALPCAYCGAPFEHVDHIMPLSKGGLHCVENLAPACQPCNDRKWTKILPADERPEGLRSCDLVG